MHACDRLGCLSCWNRLPDLFYCVVCCVGSGQPGNLNVEALDTRFLVETARLLRIDLIGSALTTSDTYSTKKAIFDLPIKYTKVGVIGDKDGNDIVDMEFTSRFNITTSSSGKIITVNQLTTNF